MVNLLDAPIPGQSLTRPRKASPLEHPPRFVQREEVQDFFFDKLTAKGSVEEVVLALRAGTPVEGLARTLVYTGVIEGLYTPDMMLLIAKDVYYLIAAIARVAGLENVQMRLPNPKREKFLDSIMPALEKAEAREEDTPLEEVAESIFSGLGEAEAVDEPIFNIEG